MNFGLSEIFFAQDEPLPNEERSEQRESPQRACCGPSREQGQS
jgi:hypothetical protein